MINAETTTITVYSKSNSTICELPGMRTMHDTRHCGMCRLEAYQGKGCVQGKRRCRMQTKEETPCRCPPAAARRWAPTAASHRPGAPWSHPATELKKEQWPASVAEMRPLARSEEENATSDTRSDLQVELACGAVAPSPRAATPPRPRPGADGWGLVVVQMGSRGR
jgi:hypothetical protein